MPVHSRRVPRHFGPGFESDQVRLTPDQLSKLTQNPPYKSPPRGFLQGTARPTTPSHELASSTLFKTRRAVCVIHLLCSLAGYSVRGLTFLLTAQVPLPSPTLWTIWSSYH